MWDNPALGEWEMENRVRRAHREAERDRLLYQVQDSRAIHIRWLLTTLVLGGLLDVVLLGLN